MRLFLLAAALAVTAACSNPIGTDPAGASGYENSLQPYVQAVEDITPLPADPNAGEIYTYVVMTWDEVHIYVNGVVVGTQIPGNAWRCDGVMSGIKIYVRTLEEAEVPANYGG